MVRRGGNWSGLPLALTSSQGDTNGDPSGQGTIASRANQLDVDARNEKRRSKAHDA